MPDRSDSLEQLNRALDRIASDQPSPVLNDPDLDNLAQLAGALRRQLPKDMPDPGYRAELKSELINPHPKLVSFPARQAPRQYPVGAFAGALLAVMLSSVVVGWIAFAPSSNEVRQLTGGSAAAQLTPTAVASASTAAVMITSTRSAAGNQSDAEAAGEPAKQDQVGLGALMPEQATEQSQQTEQLATPEPTTPSEENAHTEAAQAAQPTATAVKPANTPESTVVLAAAGLPPVDRDHVELGALATIAPVSGPVSENVKFILRSELPELQSTAPVYRFVAPNVEAAMLVEGISQVLNIDADIEQAFEFGKMIYTVASETSFFSWSPDSGAFSCRLNAHEEAAESVTDVAQAALDWLSQLGYPINTQSIAPLVEQLESGNWKVSIPLSDAPSPTLGHPLTVSLILRPDGAVVEASGYWLKPTQLQDHAIMTAEEAWQALLDGQGYWTNGFNPDSRGEFVIESIDVQYVLTRDDDGEVVLQPVVSAFGSFHSENGDVAPDQQVILQAATGA